MLTFDKYQSVFGCSPIIVVAFESQDAFRASVMGPHKRIVIPIVQLLIFAC